MGNCFFCVQLNHSKEIKVDYCLQNQNLDNEMDKEIIIKEDFGDDKYFEKINKLKKYFNEQEKEITNNFYRKEKSKINLNKKKHINVLSRLSENKYELMLKRLLEQKKVKRSGPKRRDTIRNEEKIKIIVNEILFENINAIKINKKTNVEFLNQENDLLIKNINIPKYRISATVDKNQIIENHLNQNLKKFQYRNTINEIINESSACSGLCKKQTNSSPPNKK